MDNLLALTLEAHHPERNHHRRYSIRVGRDLFGEWTLSFGFGRTGRGGTEIQHSSADPQPLIQLVRRNLRRRLSAIRRIGCEYEISEFNMADSAADIQWFPAELLSEFRYQQAV